MKLTWSNIIKDLESRGYICGYCGSSLASERGWYATPASGGKPIAYLYVCHKCSQPTYFSPGEKQTPGVTYGNPVESIPNESVKSLYKEARDCTAKNAYTAVVLCCRKLLMNIAVSKEAKPGQSFIKYVEYLSDQGYIPPDGKAWVDQIRSKGNEANHEIKLMKKEDAEELINFLEMLLKFIYEFPAKISTKKPSDSQNK